MYVKFDGVLKAYVWQGLMTHYMLREREIGTDILLYTIVTGAEGKIRHSLPHSCHSFSNLEICQVYYRHLTPAVLNVKNAILNLNV